MGLISKEDVLKRIEYHQSNKVINRIKTVYAFEMLKSDIEDIPEIEERKEGEWIEEYDEEASMFLKRRWRCTACNNWQTYGRPKFCPHCGARMKGE